MKFFVSSLIRGMDAERAAAVDAIEGLGHQAVLAEGFGAKAESPQIACLTAVRESDGLVLIAGAKYGVIQASGKSATHEEYEAALGNKPTFIFVDANGVREPKQEAFLQQAQDWKSGAFTARYNSPAQLRQEVSKALHQWILAQAAGAFDADEAVLRAKRTLPPEQRGYSTGTTRLAISVAPGPAQTILRPSALEAPELGQHVVKEALFGVPAVFTASRGTQMSIEGHALWLRQESEAISLSEDGSIQVVRVLSEGDNGVLALIVEELEEKIASSLLFAAALLDHVDPTHRLTHAAIAASLYEAEYRSWRTRAQHAAQPTSGTMNMRDGASEPVTLQPAHRQRSVLKREAAALAKDLVVLLRRTWTN